MTTDVIYIRRSAQNDSIVKFSTESKLYEFDSGMDYTDATIYLKKNMVVVFHSISNKNSDFVGAIFELNGKKIYDIPYPEMKDSYVHCRFSWSSEIDNGLKMIFLTDSVSQSDFWCDFDFERRLYVARGRTR